MKSSRTATELQNLITADCDARQLMKQAIKEGMRPLRLSGAEKVAAGNDHDRGSVAGRAGENCDLRPGGNQERPGSRLKA